MNDISFTTANFVAREVGYHMPEGWGQGDQAANAWFSPIETYRERLDAVLGEVAALGFSNLDLWVAHLNFGWATPQHFEIVRSLVADRKMKIVCYGGVGNTIADLRKVCNLCAALNIPMMRGATTLLVDDRKGLVDTLRDFGLRYGLENHPETSVEEVLTKIGASDPDVIGVTLDVGWFVTRGVNAPAATRELAARLMNYHMKDVKAPRAEPSGFPMADMGHETCRLGAGVADIIGCVKALKDIGYSGPIAIEHEPESYDPTADLAASRVLLEGWLKEV